MHLHHIQEAVPPSLRPQIDHKCEGWGVRLPTWHVDAVHLLGAQRLRRAFSELATQIAFQIHAHISAALHVYGHANEQVFLSGVRVEEVELLLPVRVIVTELRSLHHKGIEACEHLADLVDDFRVFDAGFGIGAQHVVEFA